MQKNEPTSIDFLHQGRMAPRLLLLSALFVVAAAASSVLIAPAATSASSAAGAAPPPPPALFFGFDAGFGDNMVLQMAPAAAAVYGYLDTAAATGVRVTVSDASGAPLYSVDAELNATTQPFGDGWGARPCPKAACPPYDMATFTPFAGPLPTWKALLRATPAGGNYTVSAVCTGCTAAAKPAQMSNVVFGDVWVCAGQSNAMLWVSHTFSRNASAQSYAAGKFNNIRIMGGSDVNEPYTSWPPAYGGGPRASNPWMTAAEAVPAGCVETQKCPLFQTSGACWYALQAAAELGVSVPLGLVALTLGGQRIEEFMNNNSGPTGPYVCENLNSQNIVSVPARRQAWTLLIRAHACAHFNAAFPYRAARCPPAPIQSTTALVERPAVWHIHAFVHRHDDQRVAVVPGGFACSMRVHACASTHPCPRVPAQGENNMGGQKGNVIANTGYSCAMRQLINGWRAAWSKTPGTTDALAPFGVVTLASSGSEGGPDFGTMRVAQTMSYGVLPTPDVPNTFVAQAYDLDDEWGPGAGPCFGGKGRWACCPGGGSGACGSSGAYNATTCAGREALCAPACAADSGTPCLMGGIHPRSKKPVGDRLGRAMYNTVYGGSGAFTGPTLSRCSLAGDGSTLSVEFNASLLRGDLLALQDIQRAGGSQLFVQTNASLFCMEPQCVINATSGRCANINPANPREGVAMYCPSWAGGDNATVFPVGALDSGWLQLNYTAAASGTAVVVDLAPLKGAAPTAVRYAWGMVDCCDHTDPTLYVSHGCIAQCPITSSSGLPANPFQAKVVGGACTCVAPQVCS